MADQARRSSTWVGAWEVGGAALVVGNATYAALTHDRIDRVDALVGAGSSVLIPLMLLVDPPRILEDDRELEEALAAGREGPCDALAHAERLLARDAKDQAARTGLVAQSEAIGFNLALGATLAAFGHWKGAMANGLGGVAICEAQFFTAPTGAERGLDAYRAGRLGDVGGPAAGRWDAGPFVTPRAVGARLSVSF